LLNYIREIIAEIGGNPIYGEYYKYKT
jgi:hypothetical protein